MRNIMSCMLFLLVIGCNSEIVSDECNVPRLIGELEDQVVANYSSSNFEIDVENTYDIDILSSCYDGDKGDWCNGKLNLKKQNAFSNYRGDCTFGVTHSIAGFFDGKRVTKSSSYYSNAEWQSNFTFPIYVNKKRIFTYSNGRFFEE